MKTLLRLVTTFFLFSIYGLGSEWLYYKHFPWVYDNKENDWMYLHGGEDGKIYAYSSLRNTWSEFPSGETSETVLSYTNGEALVVKSGSNYSWSDTLEGMVLWAVIIEKMKYTRERSNSVMVIFFMVSILLQMMCQTLVIIKFPTVLTKMDILKASSKTATISTIM